MEISAYQTLARQEGGHWYYRFRRQVLRKLIRDYFTPGPEKSVLDIGAGTGGTTKVLEGIGELYALEPSEAALPELRKSIPTAKVLKANAEQLDTLDLPTIDLITIVCVLYHKEVLDPASVIKQCASLQTKGGLLIWQEPTYEQLKRRLDLRVHGARRFFPRQMKTLLEKAGYQVLEQTPILAWAYPFALLAKYFEKKDPEPSGQESFEHSGLPSLVSKLLRTICYIEWSLMRLGLGKMFRGVSMIMIAQKKTFNDSNFLTNN